MSLDPKNEQLDGADGPHFNVGQEGAADVSPWTEIEPGRFMPRRVRGSMLGRALG